MTSAGASSGAVARLAEARGRPLPSRLRHMAVIYRYRSAAERNDSAWSGAHVYSSAFTQGGRRVRPSPNTPTSVPFTFRKAADAASAAVGSPWAFAAAALVVLVWAATGPTFHYSDTWQLIINTGTTVVTFLMVFLIQNTQNRDARVTQLKLDELIRAVAGARTSLVDMEHMSDQELERLQSEFESLRNRAAVHREKRRHKQPR